MKPTYEELLVALTRIRDREHEEDCRFKYSPLSECPDCPTDKEIAEEVLGLRPACQFPTRSRA